MTCNALSYLFECLQSTNSISSRAMNYDRLLCNGYEYHQDSSSFNWKHMPICFAECFIEQLKSIAHQFAQHAKSENGHKRPKCHQQCKAYLAWIWNAFRLENNKCGESPRQLTILSTKLMKISKPIES